MYFIKKSYVASLLLFIGLACNSSLLYSKKCCYSNVSRPQPFTITYYLNVSDFAKSFIQIKTSNVLSPSSTIASSYLAGEAPIYNAHNKISGTCSASFLSMKSKKGIFTAIANYISAADGLIVTWFTPTKLANLELDSIIHGMVTECIVTVTTKVGASLFYGQTFTLVVSSKNGRIYFQFTRKL